MAVVKVQEVTQSDASGSTTQAITIAAPANGNALIASIGVTTNGGTVSSIAQTGATWVKAKSSNTQLQVEIWYALAVSGAGTTVTITYGSVVGGKMANITEWTGVLSAAALDQSGSSSNASSANPSTPTRTILQANELIIGNCNDNQTMSAPTGGFTGLTQVDGSTHLATSYLVTNSIAAYATGWTAAAGSGWDANIATFFAAAGTARTDEINVTLVDASHRRRRVPRSDLAHPAQVSVTGPVLIPIRAYFAPVVRTVRSRSRWLLRRPPIVGAPLPPVSPPSPVIDVILAASNRRHARRIPKSFLRRPVVVAAPSQFQARRTVLTLFPRRWRRIHPRSKLRPPAVISAVVPPAAIGTCATGPLAYLKFGDVEIANIARTLEYLRNGLGNRRWEIGDCAACPVLYTEDSDDCTRATFVSPATDPAPWYQATEPGSSTFLGVALLDISGYDSTVTREVTARVGSLGGASFSGQRRNPRVWKFRAALVSSDDLGAEYGLRWLTSALEASACNTCPPSNLTVRLVCPPANCTNDELGRWKSYEVALTEGPTEVTKWSPGGPEDALYGCRDLVVVEWTMTAGNPLLYKEAQVCLAPEVIGVTIDCTDICDFLFGSPGEAHCCTVAPPTRGTLGAIFTLQSVSGMNSVLLGAYANCPSGTEDNPILEMEISHVPAGGTVVVDCSQRTVSVTAPDENGDLVTTDGQSLLVLDDRHLQWIEVRPCDAITCLCARTAHPCSQGGDTLVSISTQMREG